MARAERVVNSALPVHHNRIYEHLSLLLTVQQQQALAARVARPSGGYNRLWLQVDDHLSFDAIRLREAINLGYDPIVAENAIDSRALALRCAQAPDVDACAD